MAPFISKSSTACWRSWRLFMVRKLMLWWVSWGRCWKAMPTPSSRMPVARQLPCRLRQCGAKPARRAPTWDPSTLSGRGRRRSLARLLASLEWSWTGPSGASSKGRLLCHSPLRRGGRGPQAIKNWRSRSRLLGWRHFRASGFLILLVESHRRASHSVSMPDGKDTNLKDLWIRTDHMAAFKRCRPHRRKNLGLELKFFRRASRRSNCRFDAAAKPADTAETCASWIMANFSRRSLERSSLGESSAITDATIESPKKRRLRTSRPTLQCLNTSDVTSGWKKGLVVTDSVVTRRLGHVKGITMNLETVRFPGEKLLHREELECRGDCVQGLRQCSLLYFFVIFKPLRYTCRRNQRVLQRRLVQPRYSVSHLWITQVQQRGSGRSLCLSRVDFKRSLWRSHSLSEDLVSSCWDLLTVTVIVLVIRKKLSWYPDPWPRWSWPATHLV